jgi:hypothetical protein
LHRRTLHRCCAHQVLDISSVIGATKCQQGRGDSRPAVDCQPCWRIAKRFGEFCQRVSESPVPIGHASREWCALDRVGAWPRRRSPTLNSTGTNFSPILVATRAARELLIQARSSGPAARTVGQQRPPESPLRPRSSARQLGCQSRQLSWQATPANGQWLPDRCGRIGPPYWLSACAQGVDFSTGLARRCSTFSVIISMGLVGRLAGGGI